MGSALSAAGGSALGVMGGIAGAGIEANATRHAEAAQSDAANNAANLQYQMYQQQRNDLAPWRQAGESALSGMQDPRFQKSFSMADFQADPGYQFRMEQGQKALEASAAARGGLMSGNFATALSQYGQNFASNEYQNAYSRFTNDQNNRFNRLSSIAGLGQNALGMMGAAAQNYANQAGQDYIGAGNAHAASYIKQGQLWGGAVNNSLSGIGNNWMQYSAANQAPAAAPTAQAMPTSAVASNYAGPDSLSALAFV